MRRDGWIVRGLAWGLAAALVLEPLAASAAIDDSLTQFFNDFAGTVTATSPGAYQSQTRGYLSGGSLSARVPMQSTQLVSFQPPSFRMGCNGFDATLGGLSYVSFDRFLQLLQQLGTGATMGFAFQLALKYMSPTIHDVLNKLEAAARQLNSTLNVAPCQTGMQVGAAVADAIFGKNMNGLSGLGGMLEQRWKVATGALTDPLHNIHEVADKTPATVAQALAADPQWNVRGNLVWDVLKRLNYPEDQIRWLMSLVGTVVVDDQGAVRTYDPILSLNDVLMVNNTPVAIYACSDPCLNPVPTQEPFQGLAPRIEQVLGDITTKLAGNQPLTVQEESWMNAAQIPIYTVFRQHRQNPDMQVGLARNGSRFLAASLLENYLRNLLQELAAGIAVYKQARPTWSGDTRPVTDRIHAVLREALEIERGEAQKVMAVHATTNAVMQQAGWSYRKR